MKQHIVTTYSFNELEEDVQKHVLEKERFINTEGLDWWDGVYEDFKILCEKIGIEVNLSKTFFRGFYSQGDGSSFTSSVDIISMIEGVNEEKWKEYAPEEGFNFGKFEVRPATLNLLERGLVSVTVTSGPARGYGGDYCLSTDYDYDCGCDHKKIAKQLQDIGQHACYILNQLNRWLYRSLEKECEYLQSDEVVKETIKANEYEFTKNGNLF